MNRGFEEGSSAPSKNQNPKPENKNSRRAKGFTPTQNTLRL